VKSLEVFKCILDELEKNPENAESCIENFIKNSPLFFFEDQNKLDIFFEDDFIISRSILEKNKKILSYLKVMVMICEEFGKDFFDKYKTKSEEDLNIKFIAFRELHAKATLKSKAILSLLVNGYPDDAFGLWRSLFELQVIASFLDKNQHDIAERFILWEHIINYQRANEFNNKTLNDVKKITQEDISSLKKAEEEIIKKYNLTRPKNGFSDYEWASQALSKKGRISFYDIVCNVNLNYFYPYYSCACEKLHSSFKTNYAHLGLSQNSMGYLVGPSPYGFEDPIMFSIFSLYTVTLLFLKSEGSLENKLKIALIGSVYNFIHKTINLNFEETPA